MRSYFNGDEIGFYLDIGCNDPITYSNTWLLYLKGWKGIAIDANPTLIERYKSTRTRDIAITAVISDVEQEVDFYYPKNSDLTSGIGELKDSKWQRTRDNSVVVRRRAT